MNRLTAFFIASLFLIFATTSCNKKSDPPKAYGGCEDQVNTQSREYFEQDAFHLSREAMRKDSNSAAFSDIFLNVAHQELILQKLSAIYNAAATDSILSRIIFEWQVHKQPVYSPNSLLLGFSSIEQRDSFVNDPAILSNTAINQAIVSYGFTAHSVGNWTPHATLESSTNFNTPAIVDAIRAAGFSSVSVSSLFVLDGNSLEYEEQDGNMLFTLGYGWGDCPSGCFGHHYWVVKVDKTCSVSIVNDYGDPVPE